MSTSSGQPLPHSLTSGNPAPPWRLTTFARYGIYLLYVFAGYFFARAHILTTFSYLKLPDYLAGHERLPFQRRVLPMLLVRQLLRIPLPARFTHGANGVLSQPVLTYLFLIDLVAVAVTAYFCIRLYYKAASRPRFGFLVFPIFLFAASWTYIIHTEQNLYYPYDMLSLAFFTAGLYCVYMRRFAMLLAIMVIGTLNRETTLFLIPIFVLDSIVPLKLRSWSRLPWGKTLLLVLAWCSVKYVLSRHFVYNDHSEDYFRLGENFRILTPKNWPELLGGCGYLLPVIWFCRRRIQNPRIARWTLVIPMWVFVMMCYGVMSETRIYGELCGLIAVASALLLDSYAVHLGGDANPPTGLLPSQEAQ